MSCAKTFGVLKRLTIVCLHSRNLETMCSWWFVLSAFGNDARWSWLANPKRRLERFANIVREALRREGSATDWVNKSIIGLRRTSMRKESCFRSCLLLCWSKQEQSVSDFIQGLGSPSQNLCLQCSVRFQDNWKGNISYWWCCCASVQSIAVWYVDDARTKLGKDTLWRKIWSDRDLDRF